MNSMTRRCFAATSVSWLAVATSRADAPKQPAQEEFVRDYPAPKFKPSFAKPQLSKLLVQDFVIFAHSDLEMTKKLLEKQPALANAFMDWGAGDWESGLGGAAHMGRRDIAEFLISHGARIDIFAAAMLGQLDAVKQLISQYPKLIDARGPHGFSLHHHAKVGGEASKPVLEYLQIIKYVDLKPQKPEKKPKNK